jgi:AsmA family protein
MRKILRILALCCAGLAAAIVVAAIYVAYFFEWNRLRSPLAERLSAQAGRDFRIEGDLDVDLGWTTRVRAEGVRLDNVAWGSAPAMAEIEAVEFGLRVPELLRGRVVLPDLVLTRPRLLLERNAEAENNWTFDKGPVAEASLPEERDEFPFIGRLKIEEGKLRFRDEARKLDIEAELATATGKGQPATEAIRLSGEGKLEGRPLRLTLVGGSLLSLREEKEPWPIQGELAAGDTRLEFEGSMVEPIKLENVDVRLRVRGSNMGALFPLLGIPTPDTPPYDLAGRVIRDKDVWTLADLNGKVGDSDVTGVLRFDAGGERLMIEGDLVSANLDFDDLGLVVGAPVRTQGENETASEEQKRFARAYASRERVLPDAPLDFKRVRAVDAKISFKGTKVDAGPLPLDEVALNLDLQNGVMKLAPLGFAFADGRLDYYVTIDARRDQVSAAHDIRLRNAELARVLADAGLEGAGSGRFNGRIELKTTGNSIRKALATANGRAAFVMAGGNLQALGVEALGLDIAESLTLMATEPKAPTPIRCAVLSFDVAGGVMESKVIVVDTVDSKITADASIDLRNETYRAGAIAHPKDASLLSARAAVTVQGTFKSVQVGVEPAGLAARGAAAVALGALLTPLAAILPFVEPGLAKDADCAALVSEASRQTRSN